MTQGDPTSLIVAGARVASGAEVEVARNLFIAAGVFVNGPLEAVDVFDAQGGYAVPLLVESAVAERPTGQRGIYDLRPGNPATFALIRRPVTEFQIRRMLVVNPADLVAVYVGGHQEVRQGAAIRPAGEDLVDPETSALWVGTWEDPMRGLQQHLAVDGRYSETRGGRKNAYTGRYWVRDARITYFDDSGFWAFGELLDGTLHHAGFVMTRAGSW